MWEKPRGTNSGILHYIIIRGPAKECTDGPPGPPDQPSNWAVGDFKCFVNPPRLSIIKSHESASRESLL